MHLQFVARLTIGLVLAVASFGKWWHLSWFASVLSNYVLIPPPFARVAALLVTTTESLIAILLLFGLARPMADFGAIVFLITVTAAMAVNLAGGRKDVECGCSGRPGHKISWTLVARNIGLAGLAFIASEVLNIDSALEPGLFVVCVALVVWPSLVSVLRSKRDHLTNATLRALRS